MVPLFAALSAVDTASKVLDLGSSGRHKTAAGSAQGEQAKSPTSFASLLETEKADVGKSLGKALPSLAGAAKLG